ncbi:MAG: hypothetical protein MZV49_24980 [Rhodopseudomonas palustris]|nr:hypothetical protein [Rhodopseudomonas palustris]
MRVFAALGSMISAVLVVYPVLPDWAVWTVLRVLIGFSFSGVYITAESWLNNTATNETRGQAMSALHDGADGRHHRQPGAAERGRPLGLTLFVIPSVLVSLAFMPILLSATPDAHLRVDPPAARCAELFRDLAAGRDRDAADGRRSSRPCSAWPRSGARWRGFR